MRSRQGSTDGNRFFPIAGANHRARRVGRIFRRPIEIVYARLRRLLRQLFEQDRRQWFSGKIDSANRCRKRVVAQIFAQQTWNGVDQADLGDIPQTRQIEERVGQHHLTAAGKRSENLEYGEIEADRGRCQDARKLVTGEVVGGPLHTGGGIAMRDRHALRSTRRP